MGSPSCDGGEKFFALGFGDADGRWIIPFLAEGALYNTSFVIVDDYANGTGSFS